MENLLETDFAFNDTIVLTQNELTASSGSLSQPCIDCGVCVVCDCDCPSS